jgi:hypothetical protein
MNFIHFGFLTAGAAAMSLPILIHLLLRQRAKPMEIGSIRFVRHVVRRSKSRQRIQRWLLLLLRSLAVLLLGCLFARPFLPDVAEDGSSREVVVLIDRSASMSVIDNANVPAIDNSISRVKKSVQGFGDQARVHLAAFDATQVEPIELKDLSRLRVSDAATRFDEAFAWALDILATSDRKDQSILLVSDLQRNGIGQLSLESMPGEIEISIEDPAPSVSENLAIESVSPTQTELRPGVPVQLSVRLYNPGAFTVSAARLNVELKGPSETINRSMTVEAPAGSRQTLPLELDIKSPGIYQGRISLQRDDAYAFDNARYVAFHVRHPDRLLLVDGDPGQQSWENSTYYVETALRLKTPIGSGPPRTFEVERIVWDRGNGFPSLEGYRMILMANLGRFSDKDAARLLQYIRGGGNVVWFMGERTTPQTLSTLDRTGLLAGATFGTPVDMAAYAMEFRASHPVFEPFGNLQYGDLRSLRTRRLVPVDVTGSDVDVLLGTGKHPLVLSQEVDSGQLVLITTSADRSWSDWPENRLFVPLIRQISSWLTGQLDDEQSVVTKFVDQRGESAGIENTDRSLIVRNVPAAESDIQRVAPEQFREAVGLRAEDESLEFGEDLSQFAPAGVSRPDEKWPLLIWVLLAVLAAEFLLASRVHE